MHSDTPHNDKNSQHTTNAQCTETTLTHFTPSGEAHMVSISDKSDSHRQAIAEGQIHVSEAVQRLIIDHGHKKGDVLGIARIAAIMAAKKTADIIPLCHPIPITHIHVDFDYTSTQIIRCTVTCDTIGKTGIEMEALTACSAALLTIYDMCKAVDKSMTIESIRLVKKTGGKSGDFSATECQ
ncbi:cyclic pyranopterin monophosphate synthase MoaC [Cardiobacteriales bacterium ML27]|uniref:Cyclic pyranopterin monophosphate synthase n=2 Tax=Ostreibacterium oceani TaxID=2654998 RepID=A0A6N7ET85_9GAMM|nr:cyclic pyranopterin monophosphate synthase MoaC [Ostreibacterium oceani]